jgi:hypothetical protein
MLSKVLRCGHLLSHLVSLFNLFLNFVLLHIDGHALQLVLVVTLLGCGRDALVFISSKLISRLGISVRSDSGTISGQFHVRVHALIVHSS